MTKAEIIRLGEQLAADESAASDLWSWLPSHKVARKHHGDYADTVRPTAHDVMVEATMFIAFVREQGQRAWTPEEESWFGRCPCGEDHLP